MQESNWGRITARALILGLIVYLVMRFVVPHSIDSDTRSLIGAAVAFVASMIIGQVTARRKRV